MSAILRTFVSEELQITNVNGIIGRYKHSGNVYALAAFSFSFAAQILILTKLKAVRHCRIHAYYVTLITRNNHVFSLPSAICVLQEIPQSSCNPYLRAH